MGESFHWFYGGDGHGSNIVIDLLQSLDPAVVMAKQNSLNYILEQFEPHIHNHNYRSSGSTYYEAKVYNDRAEVCIVGDSQVAIFIDNRLEYISTPHNLKNPLEKARLEQRMQDMDVYVKSSGDIAQIMGADKVKLRDSEYIYFKNSEKLAMSQSLGHQNVTGVSPELFTIPLHPGQTVCIVGGSDGLWEMVNFSGEDAEGDMAFLSSKSAEDIVAMAEGRWKQEWNIYWKDPKSGRDLVAKQRFPANGYDDISACVIRKTII